MHLWNRGEDQEKHENQEVREEVDEDPSDEAWDKVENGPVDIDAGQIAISI